MRLAQNSFKATVTSAIGCLLTCGALAQSDPDNSVAAGRPDTVQPARIIDNTALVGPSNTWIDKSGGMLMAEFLPAPRRRDVDMIRASEKIDGVEMVNGLVRRGQGVGLSGILYDNRDGDHSTFKANRWPHINFVRYARQFQERGLSRGAAGNVQFSLPVIGNSSTAQTKGPYARSQGRIAVADQSTAARAFRLYANNHLYFYPEHRDHDPKKGDLFFANVPFFLMSQGSSGSDQPLMKSVAIAIASLQPDTFQRLVQTRLLAPTLQMIFRMSQKGITGTADYLSGPAHPSAFPTDGMDVVEMIQLAQSLRPDQIPPMVSLKVEKDFLSTPGIDFLETDVSEKLFTTPAAISRAWRSTVHEREVVLSAQDTRDPNGRDLIFEWVILRGDPERIEITHADDDPNRTRARIRMAWHEAYTVPGNDELETRRIDIGVFARNGATVSAPSFFSVVFPTHQARRYEDAPEGGARIAEIDYAWDARRTLDPMLWTAAPWTDSFTYAPNRRAATVTRHYVNGRERELTQGVSGLVEVKPDQEIVRVVHQRKTDKKNRPVLDDGLGVRMTDTSGTQ